MVVVLVNCNIAQCWINSGSDVRCNGPSLNHGMITFSKSFRSRGASQGEFFFKGRIAACAPSCVPAPQRSESQIKTAVSTPCLWYLIITSFLSPYFTRLATQGQQSILDIQVRTVPCAVNLSSGDAVLAVLRGSKSFSSSGVIDMADALVAVSRTGCIQVDFESDRIE